MGAWHIGLGGDFDGVSDLPIGLDDVAAYPALLILGYALILLLPVYLWKIHPWVERRFANRRI